MKRFPATKNSVGFFRNSNTMNERGAKTDTRETMKSMIDVLNGCIDAFAEIGGVLSDDQLSSLSDNARMHVAVASLDLDGLYRGFGAADGLLSSKGISNA